MATLQQVRNFAEAAWNHLIKGMPKASTEDIARRLEICLTCPYFKRIKKDKEVIHGICTHEHCGCNITNKDEKKFLNKIAWADQNCPVGKWGKIKKGSDESEPLMSGIDGNDYY
jgi:hypothetical protein